MDVIGDLLRAIRSRYDDARRHGLIHGSGNYYCIHDPELAQWMDETRTQVLSIFGQACGKVGVRASIFSAASPALVICGRAP